MPVEVLLHELAPQIEAAGSISAAVENGWIGGALDELAAVVPASRGGSLQHPDADADWQKLVDGILAEKGVTLEEFRRELRQVG